MTPDEWADWIAAHDDVAELKRALKKDPTLARARTGSGNTLLHEACWHKKLAMVELFVAAGADVNARGDLGRTPLHCAVHDREAEDALPIVRFLVENDALPELEDGVGHTVAEYARREIWDDPNEVLAAIGAKPVVEQRVPSDYEGTVAQIRAIQSEGETIIALRRMIEAFRDGTRFDVPDVLALREFQMILDTVAATSWAKAARELLREQFKPAHAKRLLGLYH
jgi:hypothetical protein